MGFWDFFRKDKNVEKVVDLSLQLAERVEELEKKQGTRKEKPRIPYNEELAKAGRPWRTDPKTGEKYHW